MSRTVEVVVIRTSGKEETHNVRDPNEGYGVFSDEIHALINAKGLDIVHLRDGRIMYVDDLGYDTVTVEEGPGQYKLQTTKARKPVNEKATKLYHSVCVLGTTHQIVGDVVVMKEY